jgi:hypothetical protein
MWIRISSKKWKVGCIFAGVLTLRWKIQPLFEWREHFQGKGLAFLPNINELFDLFLQEKKHDGK